MKKDPTLAVMQAEDTINLLDHIAWTQVLQPAMENTKAVLGKQLVQAVLGQEVTFADGSHYTKEQIAGKIYGIQWLESTLQKILSDGTRALDSIRANNIIE